jgi:hypothetical protein
MEVVAPVPGLSLVSLETRLLALGPRRAMACSAPATTQLGPRLVGAYAAGIVWFLVSYDRWGIGRRMHAVCANE